MGKKIAIVCIRFLAIGQTPLVQFMPVFGVLGAYTLGQFSLRPFRDSYNNVLHCSLQLATLFFCLGGLLRRMAKCERDDPADDRNTDESLLGTVILICTLSASMLMILWAVRLLPASDSPCSFPFLSPFTFNSHRPSVTYQLLGDTYLKFVVQSD